MEVLEQELTFEEEELHHPEVLAFLALLPVPLPLPSIFAMHPSVDQVAET